MATMDPKDMEEAARDFFAQLPDDVLLLILSRVEELKFLVRCSVVSKRFSATISDIKAVSVTLPSITMHTPDSVADLGELFPIILDCNGAEIISFVESSSIKELKFAVFLQKFTELRSVSLEFMSPTIFCDPPFLKWKPKCKSDGDMIEGIVSLLADSAFRLTENEFDEPRPGLAAPYLFSLSHIKCSVFYPLRCCKEWLFVLCLLLKCQSTLKSISITNAKKEAELILRGEELVEWRTNLLCKKTSNQSYPETMKMAWLPELYLPSSQRLLIGVCFVAMRFPSDSTETIEDDAMNWEYGEEEKLLHEAVNEILTNHREKLKALCFNPFDPEDDDDDDNDLSD